jgi:hypothetical protein
MRHHEINEMIMSELAASSVEIVRVHDEDAMASMEIVDHLEDINTLRFERAPYERVEVGTGTILGTGFPKLARNEIGSVTGLWFHPSDETLMRIEDLVPSGKSVWPWVGIAVGLASLCAGAIIWWML